MLLPEDVIYNILLHCDIHTVTSFCMINTKFKMDYHFYTNYLKQNQLRMFNNPINESNASLLHELHHICSTTNEMSKIISILLSIPLSFNALIVDFDEQCNDRLFIRIDIIDKSLLTSVFKVYKLNYFIYDVINNDNDYTFHDLCIFFL